MFFTSMFLVMLGYSIGFINADMQHVVRVEVPYMVKYERSEPVAAPVKVFLIK